jgi:predicted small lipoprotein YifL
MRARLPAQVALLALAGSLWGCGSPGPSPTWKTAGYVPPASGMADYQQTTAGKPGPAWPVTHPRPDKPTRPDWGKPDGGRPDWGKPDWGKPGWGPPWPAPVGCDSCGFPPFGPDFIIPPFPFGPYVPPVVVWGPFSPIPLIDIPGPPVGPVAPFYPGPPFLPVPPVFGGWGAPWGW